jgi:hypothetical protein
MSITNETFEALDVTLDETMVSLCCGAQTTFHDATLICKKCYEVVTPDSLIDCGLWGMLEQQAIDSYLEYCRLGE